MNLFASAHPRNPILIPVATIYATKEEADAQPDAARRMSCVEIDVPEHKMEE